MTKRIARGSRPEFSSDPQVDKLVSIVMSLAAEVSVLRERMDTMERLGAARGAFTTAEIDAFDVTPEIDAEREKWRAAFLDRVLWAMREEIDQLTGKEG
jgi:hypothetical protein